MKQASFYSTSGDRVTCALCAHRCTIKPGRRGICGVRENQGGELFTLVYGAVSAEHVDPVEKKPLFHFMPASTTYSIATVGCNFKCLHCQNYSLSQAGAEISRHSHVRREPREIVDNAARNGCSSISYTYSEPTIFFEFAYDCGILARERGMRNIFVSNGYMTTEAAAELAPILDAINIDLKSFSEDFYRTICGGSLQQVLDNVRFFREHGVWVEVTTLIIPDLNDTDEEIEKIASFLVACDPDIPWHVSAFRPTFQMLDRIPTSPERLHSARRLGLEAGLKHVYVGNIHGGSGEDTICPGCAETVIRRSGFTVRDNKLKDGRCPTCSVALSGIWS